MNNQQIVEQLQKHARELTAKKENLYRVRAYRQAVQTLLNLSTPVADLLQNQGKKALTALPHIGTNLAETISHYVQTGEWKTRERVIRQANCMERTDLPTGETSTAINMPSSAI